MSLELDEALSAPSRPARRIDSSVLRVVGPIVIAVVVVLAVWQLSGSLAEKWIFALTTVAIGALVASGLNFIVGYAGQVCLSSGAFMALGAYVSTLGTGTWDWGGTKVILVTVLVAAVVSMLASLVIFRAKGLHFALLTAGFSLVAYGVANSWTSVTGGGAGVSTGAPVGKSGGIPRPLTVGPVSLETTQDFCVAAIALLAVVMLCTRWFVRSRVGITTVAVREDEALSASVGVPTIRYKQLAYVIASVIAAVAGILYAHWVGYITPGSFTFAHASFDPLAMVIIGGSGTVLGPIVGAVVVAGTPEIFDGLAEYSVMVYGLVLLAVVMLAPRGIVGLVASWFHTLTGVVLRGKGRR